MTHEPWISHECGHQVHHVAASWERGRLARSGGIAEGSPCTGVTYVAVTVRNPAHRSRAWTGAFLVDTSAIDSLVLHRSLEAIGLSPTGRRTYVTADSREVMIR